MAVNKLVMPEGQANNYVNLDEIYTTTLQNWREKGKFYDNWFKTNPLFWVLHEKGRREYWDGGNPAMCNLQYGENTTLGSYSRYDILDTTPQDNQTAAYYYMRQFGGSIVIDNFSAVCNSGQYQRQNLIKVKIQEAEMTAAQRLNKMLWQGSPGSKDIMSIPELIYRTPSSSDTAPGGISGDDYEWWRPKVKIDTNITSWALLKFWMRHQYNECSKGAALMDKNKLTGSKPDVLFMDQATYEAYEGAVEADKRYLDQLGQKAASMGFSVMKYKTSLIFWDEMVYDPYTPADYTSAAKGAIYFLNTAFLAYYVHPEFDLKIKPFVEPYNQDARIAKILHYHCLVCSNRSKQGLLGYIDQDISA